MSEKLFFGIGVKRPAGLTALPGVWEGLEAMAAWARGQGYRTELVTDQAGPVTSMRLRTALKPLLNLPLDRLVVCFIGHGFLDPPDQIWIISDGPGVNTGRVSRNAFCASLQTYRPNQISLISDACLECRHFASGVVEVIDDRGPLQQRVFVDNLFSTSENAPSFAFPARTGDFCVFTSVLVDFLEGRDPRAFRLATGTSPDVTTQTLYFSLPAAVSQRAGELNVTQNPQVDPGFPLGLDVYSRFPSRSELRDVPPPPDAGTDRLGVPPTPVDPRSPLDERLGTLESDMPLLGSVELAALREAARRWDGTIAALVHHSGLHASWGFIVNEAPTGFFTGPVPDGQGSWWAPILLTDLDEPIPYVGRRPGQILTLSWRPGPESLFVMIPLFEKLIATVHLRTEYGDDARGASASGCSRLSWSPEEMLELHQQKTRDAMRVMNALTRGDLGGRDAAEIAALDPDDFRHGKHGNPMLGVVSAYLYDLVGDTDSISRMCHYYTSSGQPVPFDIALLSGGEMRERKEGPGWEVHYSAVHEDDRRATSRQPSYLWEKTPHGVGRVAGAAPILRSGWNRLGSRPNALFREFARLSDRLTMAPIATLSGDKARQGALELLMQLKLLGRRHG
jgi:hypothetical protein